MQDLLNKAKSLVGRDIEVIPTKNGKFVVEWFNFNTPPPPVGDTCVEALEKFINFIGENTDAIDDSSDKESREEIERAGSAQG